MEIWCVLPTGLDFLKVGLSRRPQPTRVAFLPIVVGSISEWMLALSRMELTMKTDSKVCPACNRRLKELPPESRRYLNEKQLARRWQLTEKTLQTHRNKSVGCPWTTIEGSIRYRLRDVYAYEQAHRRETAPGAAEISTGDDVTTDTPK